MMLHDVMTVNSNFLSCEKNYKSSVPPWVTGGGKSPNGHRTNNKILSFGLISTILHV